MVRFKGLPLPSDSVWLAKDRLATSAAAMIAKCRRTGLMSNMIDSDEKPSLIDHASLTARYLSSAVRGILALCWPARCGRDWQAPYPGLDEDEGSQDLDSDNYFGGLHLGHDMGSSFVDFTPARQAIVI